MKRLLIATALVTSLFASPALAQKPKCLMMIDVAKELRENNIKYLSYVGQDAKDYLTALREIAPSHVKKDIDVDTPYILLAIHHSGIVLGFFDSAQCGLSTMGIPKFAHNKVILALKKTSA